MSVVALVVIVFDKRAASTYVYRKKKIMQGKESYLKLNKQIRLLIVL